MKISEPEDTRDTYLTKPSLNILKEHLYIQPQKKPLTFLQGAFFIFNFCRQ